MSALTSTHDASAKLNGSVCGSHECGPAPSLSKETSAPLASAAARSTPIAVRSTGKHARCERRTSPAALSRCADGRSASSSSISLDADDEADAGPPADTPELASTPSSAPAYPGHHRWLTESDEKDASGPALLAGHGEVRVTAPRTEAGEPRRASGSSAAPPPPPPSSGMTLQPPLLRRRSARRVARSTSPPRRGAASEGVAKAMSDSSSSSSDATPSPSPVVLRSARVSLSQAPSTFSLPVGNAEEGQRGCAGDAAAPGAEGGAGEAGSHLSSSPTASSPSPAAAATAADSSDASRGLRHSAVLLSPRSPRLRFPLHAGSELQQFGCCVFFFPAPLVSWFFPLIGHVAISNAEGSRLFTFESSYYVREERLATVLDRVLQEEMAFRGSSSSGGGAGSPTWRGGPRSLDLSGRSGELSDRAPSPSPPAQSPLPLRGSAMSDASASDAGVNSPSQQSTASPLFPPRSGVRPPRRAHRSTSSTSVAATGHTHTRCVRIWDLKPLLMESRGRRTRRAPYSITREGGRQAAIALWERLQGLLQPADTTTPPESAKGSGEGAAAAAKDASLSQSASGAAWRAEGDVGEEADGVQAAPGGSSSSGGEEEEEEGQYELLDAETAHFYNRNLNATIRLFRGSADGSNNSPDVVLQHHSSFSFVGFVLEACGIGSQAKASASASAATASASGSSPNAAPPSHGSDADTAAEGSDGGAATVTAEESAELDEEIHWGAVKLLFHVCLFGKWHRGEGRLRRALHGGSITSAAILWVLVLALCVHYCSLMFA